MADFKSVPLKNGIGSIPSVGLGTWTVLGKQGSDDDVEKAVGTAIDAGYRHIDTAWVYGTQGAIGRALAQKIKDGVVEREDMFITTKLWDTHHNPSLVKLDLEDSLKSLQTTYVDMFLIHWPMPLQDQDITSEVIVPYDENGKGIPANHELKDVWKAMEGCQKAGLTRNIGLSNFHSKQVDTIMKCCTISPANIQVEISAYFSNSRLRDLCMSLGMAVTAYAPLGAPARPWAEAGDPDPFKEDVLKGIAQKKGKTVAQVILRFHIQRGLAVIPKSINAGRIQENIQVYDFSLTDDEMSAVGALDRNFRVYKESFCDNHPAYPFNEPF